MTTHNGFYDGETTEAPPNILAREFRAPAPNMRWVAGIAEMGAADGKVYLGAPWSTCSTA